LRIFQVDVFTQERFAGNPATVVLDADALSEAAMSALGREFAHAEVALVSSAIAPDHDVRVRFFNARKESPFVGHATLAAHAVLLCVGRREPGVSRQACGTGIVEVRAERAAPAPFLEFRQSAAQLESPLPLKTTLRIAEALRLPATSLDEMMPARIARKGSTRLLVPAANADALDLLAPKFDTLLSLGQELGAEGFFVFAVDRGPNGQFATQARMFCPALGIPEDPASGNAHAMLAAYLVELGQLALPGQPATFIGYQGRQMNRPAQIHVRLELEGGRLAAAHIGGHAVIVSEGSLAA